MPSPDQSTLLKSGDSTHFCFHIYLQLQTVNCGHGFTGLSFLVEPLLPA